MNQRDGTADPPREWIAAGEAAHLLGVKRSTLYSYASRGLVRTVPAPGGSRDRLYHRADLETVRARSLARSGHAPVAAAALRWGEPVLETTIGEIRADGHTYRGRSALAMARDGATFEDACALLWQAPFTVEPGPKLGVSAAHARALLGPSARPFDGMVLVAAALAATEELQPGALVRSLIAATGLAQGDDAVHASLAAPRAARALLTALGGRANTAAVAAVDEALVLVADHELNASTFAARVAASAGATLPATITAALGAASGRHHGGASARVEALVDEVGRPERAAAIVRGWLDRGESLPGFGHRLYAAGDPRGARLLELAAKLGARSRALRILQALVDVVALATRERPTVDVGLAALSSALALPRGAPLAIFACGRLAGWIAHALEQRASSFLLRPRARYVGP